MEVRLCDCPRGTLFKIGTNANYIRPPGDDLNVTDRVIKLINLDGMYSFCKLEDGTVVHIAQDANVIIQE